MKLQELKSVQLPKASGVYFFLGNKKKEGSTRYKGREVLYIGKAGVLESRVKSYFSKDISKSRSSAIALMIESSHTVVFKKTDSVLEALILEASLIKKYQPKYNTQEKDDKSFTYIVMTDEDFPRVLRVRQREIEKRKFTAKSQNGSNSEPFCGRPNIRPHSGLGCFRKNIKYMFGPFPHSGSLKKALSIIRKIFPFRDTCSPFVKKPCFNQQIGLCPGVCSGEVSKREYGRTIQNIRIFFEGKKDSLVKKLTKEMKSLAIKQEFEKAGTIKKTLFALSHIQDISLLKDLKDDIKIIHSDQDTFRIEGFDIAHIGGAETVGVMTVVLNGEVKKSEYRKFKIKTAKAFDDVAGLREVISRRLQHKEWGNPSLVVVDGGRAQKNAVEKIIKERALKIPVVSVVKDEYHKPREIVGVKKYRDYYEKEILLVNHEAHRFAITYHRKLIRRKFIGKQGNV